MGPILRAIRGWRAPWIEVRPVGGGPAPGMTGGIGAGLVARRDAFAGTVVIANAREYALRMNPAHDADPSDGALDGVSLAARTGGAMLAWVARCLLRLPLPPEARRGRAEAWELGFDRPVHLQADGDPVPGGPAREAVVRVRPGATCLLDMRGAGG
jgi:diacylglycerol kinase family enzyme